MAFILRIINLWLPVRKGENMDFFEIIYGLMYGEYVLEGYRVPLSHIVRHEFRPGSKASRIWQRAGDARERIARRLGTDDEDPDLLAMVESYEELQEYMCRRCYEYGRLCLRPARRGGQKGKAPVAQRRAPEPNEKSRSCAR